MEGNGPDGLMNEGDAEGFTASLSSFWAVICVYFVNMYIK